MRPIPQAAVDLIKGIEKLRLVAFKPLPTDPWTIGYGATGLDIVEGLEVTPEWSEARLVRDMRRAAQAVCDWATQELTENQYAALISFVYNVGVSAFHTSTMLRKINAGDMLGASAEFHRWVFSAGREIQGLHNRRDAEQALFKKA